MSDLADILTQLPVYVRKQKWQKAENRINVALNLLQHATAEDVENIENLLLYVFELISHYVHNNKPDMASDLMYNMAARWTDNTPALHKKIEFIYRVGRIYHDQSNYFYALRVYWLALKYLTPLTETMENNSTLSGVVESIKQGIDVLEKDIFQDVTASFWSTQLTNIHSLPSFSGALFQSVLMQLQPLFAFASPISHPHPKVTQCYTLLKSIAKKYKNWVGGELATINNAGSLEEYLALIKHTIPFINQLSNYGFYAIASNMYQDFLLHATDNAADLATSTQQTAAYYKHILKKIAELDKRAAGETHTAVSVIKKNWRTHAQLLATLRNNLKINLSIDPVVAQTTFNQHISHLLVTLIEESRLFLGEAPCDYTIVNIGSLARENLAPFSDIDIAIFIKERKYRLHPYFTALVTLFYRQLNLLGEIEEIGAGLYIDSKDFYCLTNENPFLLNKPKAYLYDNVDNIPIPLDISSEIDNADKYYALYHCNLLYTSNNGISLLADFQEKLAEQLQLPRGPETSLIASVQPMHRVLAKKYLDAHQQEYQDGLTIYDITSLNHYIDLKT
ncbi:MAG TPA: nucleotidyltransferase domain-containing protein, partial [Gammaproteobacteria bacterium]|nr:nucleotidyltransferase domain-containing protein [Gammaproteobacteria bacterium]